MPSNDLFDAENPQISYERDLLDRIETLEKALTEIRDFGKKNTGAGFSCSQMAEKALGKSQPTSQN